LSYLVHLQQFEGPLGLLLYLIRKEEMDIMDINVGDITRQYLDYIRMMKELDLEVAGEFVAMAATLIHIKSKMLLPTYDEEGAVEAQDPRRELVQKLLDYQKYQEAAKKLYDRPLLNRDVYARGVREDLRDEDSLTAVIVEDDGLFSLIASYRRIVRKAQRAVHQVRPRVQSIAGRINEIKNRLIVGARTTLRELLGGDTHARTQLLITFLSMLELGRMGFVSVFQSEAYGDIHIETLKPVEQNALERVQEFDSGDSESIASSIINNAVDDKIDMYEAMMAEGPSGEEAGQLSLVDAAPLGGDGHLDQVKENDSELFENPYGATEIATDDEIAAAEAELDSGAVSGNSSGAPEV
jgi:segregation and condensation protein A